MTRLLLTLLLCVPMLIVFVVAIDALTKAWAWANRRDA